MLENSCTEEEINCDGKTNPVRTVIAIAEKKNNKNLSFLSFIIFFK